MSSLARRRATVLPGTTTAVSSPSTLVTPRATVTTTEPGTDRRVSLEERLAEARNEGFEEGRQAALADLVAEEERARTAVVTEAARQLMAAAATTESMRTAILAEALGDAVELAVEIARCVIGAELELDADPTKSAIVHALGLLPEAPSVVVRAPEGWAIEFSELEQLVGGAAVTIVHDPELSAGECVIEAGPSRVDRRIDAALDRVREALADLAQGDRSRGAA